MTSGDAGVLRVQTLAGRVLRSTPIPRRLVQRPARPGRVITPSLDRGTLTVLDERGALLARSRWRVPATTPASGPRLRLYGSLTASQVDLLARAGNMVTMKWLLLVLALAVCASLPATARREGAVPQPGVQRLGARRADRLDLPARVLSRRVAARSDDASRSTTSLEDDIRAAMQAAIARQHGKKVAAADRPQVHDDATDRRRCSSTSSARARRAGPTRDNRGGDEREPAPLAAAATSGGGVPMPLLVLGGVALVLVAAERSGWPCAAAGARSL